jgi:hypothetical protein
MKKAVALIAFIAAFYLMQYITRHAAWGQAGLTGGYRDGFVGAAIRTCVAKQKAAPENVAFSEPFLASYCQCYANKLADSVSRTELENDRISNNHIPSWYQEKINAAGDICINATMKQFGLGTSQ